MTGVKSINVTMRVEGKELKAPFLLFVRWTGKQRREFADDLRTLKECLTYKGGAILIQANKLVLEGKISESTYKVLDGIFDGALLESIKPAEVEEFDLPKSKDWYYAANLAWLTMQINMVDVKELEF